MFCILWCCKLHFRRTSSRTQNYLQVLNFPIFSRQDPVAFIAVHVCMRLWFLRCIIGLVPQPTNSSVNEWYAHHTLKGSNRFLWLCVGPWSSRLRFIESSALILAGDYMNSWNDFASSALPHSHFHCITQLEFPLLYQTVLPACFSVCQVAGGSRIAV